MHRFSVTGGATVRDESELFRAQVQTNQQPKKRTKTNGQGWSSLSARQTSWRSRTASAYRMWFISTFVSKCLDVLFWSTFPDLVDISEPAMRGVVFCVVEKFGMRCVVVGCRYNSEWTCYRRPIFAFPKEEFRRREWLIAIKRPNFVIKGSSRVCAKHFEPKYLIQYERTHDDVDGPDESREESAVHSAVYDAISKKKRKRAPAVRLTYEAVPNLTGFVPTPKREDYTKPRTASDGPNPLRVGPSRPKLKGVLYHQLLEQVELSGIDAGWTMDVNERRKTVIFCQLDHSAEIPVLTKAIKLTPAPGSQHLLAALFMNGRIVSEESVRSIIGQVKIQSYRDVKLLMATVWPMVVDRLVGKIVKYDGSSSEEVSIPTTSGVGGPVFVAVRRGLIDLGSNASAGSAEENEEGRIHAGKSRGDSVVETVPGGFTLLVPVSYPPSGEEGASATKSHQDKNPKVSAIVAKPFLAALSEFAPVSRRPRIFEVTQSRPKRIAPANKIALTKILPGRYNGLP